MLEATTAVNDTVINIRRSGALFGGNPAMEINEFYQSVLATIRRTRGRTMMDEDPDSSPQLSPAAITVPFPTDPYAGILNTVRSNQLTHSGLDLNCKRSMMLESTPPPPNEDQ